MLIMIVILKVLLQGVFPIVKQRNNYGIQLLGPMHIKKNHGRDLTYFRQEDMLLGDYYAKI